MINNKRLVIKIGTKVITSKTRALDKDMVFEIVRQVSMAKDRGYEVIIVTSGAIGAGMWLLNMKKRPSELSELQAAASIGQSYLMGLYAEYFKARGFIVGQILLTQEDFNDRARYLNIKHTINALLKHGVIPIINENDTVATDEIRCGDNDRLSSLVADLCRAGKLMLLTDVDGLLDREGKVIPVVHKITPEIAKLGGKSHCDLGTGGMSTKIESIKTVTRAGIECIIANGKTVDIIQKVIDGQGAGTTFKSDNVEFMAKKRWIAFSSRPKGTIIVDGGAVVAVETKDKSLLASGIINIKGNFVSGDVVKIADDAGREFAHGLTNYSSDEILKIKGLKSRDFKDMLGYNGRDEVVHKDNLVIL